MEKSPSHHQNLAKDLNVTFKCLCDTVQNTSELLIQIPECLNRNGIISPEVASRYVLMCYTQCDIPFFSQYACTVRYVTLCTNLKYIHIALIT